jgi:hypothetical protein
MIHDSGNLPGGIKIEREKNIKTKGNSKGGERETLEYLMTLLPKSNNRGSLVTH